MYHRDFQLLLPFEVDKCSVVLPFHSEIETDLKSENFYSFYFKNILLVQMKNEKSYLSNTNK
jgi:hypothetical protein